tara:strand:- start:20892 stop:21167 length:276 start_codon:yes stop_codon:yes gene_type:complete
MNYKDATRSKPGTKFTVGKETVTKTESGKAYDFVNSKGEAFLDRMAIFKIENIVKVKAPKAKEITKAAPKAKKEVSSKKSKTTKTTKKNKK